MKREVSPDSIREEAARWLGRHDRGLSAAEQREFAEWQHADARHAAEFARLESEWKNFEIAKADPALAALAQELDIATRPRTPARSTRRKWLGAAGLATAAAIALAAILSNSPQTPLSPAVDAAPAAATYTIVPGTARQLKLEDGSVVELRGESDVAVEFTAAERRVRLVRGEAHFTVSKNPARPFIVDVGGVAVRAVGTAFNVRFEPSAIEVLVTEGRVRVDESARGESLLPAREDEAGLEPAILPAGYRASLNRSAANGWSAAEVAQVSRGEIEQSLAWQSTRLVFARTPLGEAIAVFNERGGAQLRLGEPALGERKLGGTFRADNVEGFVRVLELSAEVRAERSADGVIVLWPAR